MLESFLLTPDWEAPDNITAYVTTRHGGDSLPPYDSFNLADHVGDEPEAVISNRERLADFLPDGLQYQWLQQVHGTDIVDIAAVAGVERADAACTRVPGVVCCVLTADCLPVFLCNRDGSEVALLHAGWRGMAGGIIENSIRSLETPASELLAWLGPAIGPCHFEVGPEVKQAFMEADPASSLVQECFQPVTNSNKLMADLYQLARLKLQRLGVASITGGEHCSYCNEDQLYSYRRDGVTGRNLSLITIDK